jgi:hypothetical protein
MKKISLLQSIINERAAPEFAAIANELVPHLVNGMDGIEEMRSKRGAGYDDSLSYQIRVKPTTKGIELGEVLANIEKYLKSAESKKAGVTSPVINQKSPNSSKYSSVSFDFQGLSYDVVVAMGSNKGEDFEKSLLIKMDNLISGTEESDEAKDAFEALQSVDRCFNLSSIKSVSARTGSTKRSGDTPAEDVGKIIADIIITLKNGEKKYISIKNSSGSTVANFGVSGAISDDLKCNTSSPVWKTYFVPFGLDPKKIDAGLKAYVDQTDTKNNSDEEEVTKLKKTSPIYRILRSLWGCGYYYLREKKTGFDAMKIDADYLDNSLLKNLTVTKIRYPSKSTKQISIFLESDEKRYLVEFRNSQGKVIPKEMKFSVLGSTK